MLEPDMLHATRRGAGMATKQDLISGLNEDWAAEWGTIIRYTHQAAKFVRPDGNRASSDVSA
jgi:hypothetical protein